MHRATVLLFFLCLSYCFGVQIHGQPQSLPFSEWISGLSVKKDVKSARYDGVSQAIFKLDSNQYCRAMQELRENGPKQNTRYDIRLTLLRLQLHLQGKNCSGDSISENQLKTALQSAYEIEDEKLMFDLHQGLATYYVQKSNHGAAALHALIAVDLSEKFGKNDFHVNAGGWYGLGFVLFHSREYNACIKATAKALNAQKMENAMPGDTLDMAYRMNALNTLGLAYEKLGKADSAFIAFKQALAIAEMRNESFWKGVIKGNMGDVYFQIGQYDSAAVLLQYDFDQSMATGQFDNAANSLQWLARIDLQRGDANAALQKLRTGVGLLQQAYQAGFMENTLYAFTQAFAALGKADSVHHYMQQYMVLHDALEKAAYDSRAEIVNLRMENQSNVYTILNLNKEKRRIALIRNFSIVLILLFFIVGYLLFNRQKLKFRIRQQEALESKRLAEAEAAQAISRLNDFTKNMVEKTSLIENLQHQLLHKETNEEQILRISELTQQTILTDEDWEKFKGLFEKVYPGFFHALRLRSTDITLAELRMAALCKLQVPPKEAANLLGISPNSVNKTRQRLRHRLGLDPDANLELYFTHQA